MNGADWARVRKSMSRFRSVPVIALAVTALVSGCSFSYSAGSAPPRASGEGKPVRRGYADDSAPSRGKPVRRGGTAKPTSKPVKKASPPKRAPKGDNSGTDQAGDIPKRTPPKTEPPRRVAPETEPESKPKSLRKNRKKADDDTPVRRVAPETPEQDEDTPGSREDWAAKRKREAEQERIEELKDATQEDETPKVRVRQR